MGKQKIIWAAFICVIVITIILVAVSRNTEWHPSNQTVGENVPTRAPVPAGAVAPNEGSRTVSANVAVPTVQVAAAPGSDASYRNFNISIKNNTYIPSTIIVNQGDTVNLEMTAVDANYGFDQPDYGLHSTIQKGKTQQVQFQAVQAGKFTFYCAACGGPAKGPVGYMVITNQ